MSVDTAARSAHPKPASIRFPNSCIVVLSQYRGESVTSHTHTHHPKIEDCWGKKPENSNPCRLALDEDTDGRRGGDIHTYLPDPSPNIGHVSRVHETQTRSRVKLIVDRRCDRFLLSLPSY